MKSNQIINAVFRALGQEAARATAIALESAKQSLKREPEKFEAQFGKFGARLIDEVCLGITWKDK